MTSSKFSFLGYYFFRSNPISSLFFAQFSAQSITFDLQIIINYLFQFDYPLFYIIFKRLFHYFCRRILLSPKLVSQLFYSTPPDLHPSIPFTNPTHLQRKLILHKWSFFFTLNLSAISISLPPVQFFLLSRKLSSLILNNFLAEGLPSAEPSLFASL